MTDESSLDIAVVGISARFPGAPDVAAYWDLLRSGTEATRRLGPAELDAAGVPAAVREDPRYVPAWSGITGAQDFDAGLFGFGLHEASLIDPQHRLFLESGWQALEDAGISPDQFSGAISVYAACGLNQYLLENLLPNAELVGAVGQTALAIASDKDNLATRAAYKLGLAGPAMTVQSNCSSAMVGVHHAINSLLDFESDAALVGAAAIKNPSPRGYRYEPGGVVSPDGICRAFDRDANGYFLGDGAGAVVLRRRQDAEESGDRIYCLIKSTAVNNDGSAKVSFTAPSRSGQSAVIRSAVQRANVDPATVAYVEANGSGTVMGDAIEVTALAEAYASTGARQAPLLIGSVKPNLGNLDAASGIASLIKAVLTVHHGELPPSLHYREPNAQTTLGDSQVKVNDKHADWPAQPGPRRAAVSSFGVGGTNVHAILEQAPAVPIRSALPPAALVTWSGATATAAERVRESVRHQLAEGNQNAPDAGYTTQVGRRALPWRGWAVTIADSDGGELASAGTAVVGADPAVVFVIRPVMAAAPELHSWLPGFRAEFDAVAEQVDEVAQVDVRRGEPTELAGFVTQYSLARFLMAGGAKPYAIVGEGTGRFVAAVLQGTLSLTEAVKAIVCGGPAPAPRAEVADGLTVDLGPEIFTYAGLLAAVGRLWGAGCTIDWPVVFAGTNHRRVGLATYPFERVRCWIDPPAAAAPLAAPVQSNRAVVAATGVDHVSPRSPLERAVADVWERRLGITGLGVFDSFLTLGGDSLVAAQVLGELNDLFCVELSLRAFLTDPTVAALAAIVRSEQTAAAEIRAALADATAEV